MNKFIVMGRLTKEPEISYTSKQTMMAKFTLAVPRDYAREGEEKQTDFFNIIAFANTAEFISKYFNKGQRVVIVGRVENNKYEDENGEVKYSSQVVANEVYFADSKKNDETKVENSENTDDLPF